MSNSNPLLFRYPPNTRFLQGDFKKQVETKVRIDSFGDSVTDKESYRLSLTAKRGSMGVGSSSQGWYMFPDGKYDHDKDFSYFYRKDLSIVDIDNYIKNMTEAQKKADKNLATEIQHQIDLAQDKKEEIIANQNKTANTDSSE